MFLIKSLKSPSHSFNIYNFVSFTSLTTRLSAANKLTHHRPSSSYPYSNNIFIILESPIYGIMFSVIDLTLPISTIHNSLKEYFWSHFISHFDSNNPYSFRILAHAVDVPVSIPRTDCYKNLNN